MEYVKYVHTHPDVKEGGVKPLHSLVQGADGLQNYLGIQMLSKRASQA